jgi:hypothetical protein
VAILDWPRLLKPLLRLAHTDDSIPLTLRMDILALQVWILKDLSRMDVKLFEGLKATFEHDDMVYAVTGWMGYSKMPYRDDLMAGVRIYCRGKIEAQTHIFNLKAGFTGEYDVRSYLVGELNADWLDEAEDLIRTDRQDIFWSSPIAKAFEEWGQKAVKAIGTLTREPMRKATWNIFRVATHIEAKVAEEYPGEHQEAIREKTLEIA